MRYTIPETIIPSGQTRPGNEVDAVTVSDVLMIRFGEVVTSTPVQHDLGFGTTTELQAQPASTVGVTLSDQDDDGTMSVDSVGFNLHPINTQEPVQGRATAQPAQGPPPPAQPAQRLSVATAQTARAVRNHLTELEQLRAARVRLMDQVAHELAVERCLVGTLSHALSVVEETSNQNVPLPLAFGSIDDVISALDAWNV